ncbi:MAG: hypothetical protein JRN37_04405 [Nitrososphaerota archaeon]|jgi:hypothetical protein|nr:hypothetical protein [Nitrososphaerota archaeon]MDG7038388.1 hypothetical protein [Nitrososphaerota archaeon]
MVYCRVVKDYGDLPSGFSCLTSLRNSSISAAFAAFDAMTISLPLIVMNPNMD